MDLELITETLQLFQQLHQLVVVKVEMPLVAQVLVVQEVLEVELLLVEMVQLEQLELVTLLQLIHLKVTLEV